MMISIPSHQMPIVSPLFFTSINTGVKAVMYGKILWGLIQARVDFAAEAIKHRYTVKEIADYLNFTERYVRKMLKKARES